MPPSYDPSDPRRCGFIDNHGHVDADAGNGRLALVEERGRRGNMPPLHVHHRDDETFIVEAGTVTFEVGDERIPAAAGDVAFGPRAVPHRYDVGPEGCTMLFVLTPGGRFDEMVREMSVPADARTLPPPTVPMPDIELVARVAAAYGCELLAPPPG